VEPSLQNVEVDYYFDAPWQKEATAFEIRSQARALFAMIDQDKNGVLEKRETLNAIRNDPDVIRAVRQLPEMRAFLNPANFKTFYAKMDTDNNKVVDESEFVNFVLELNNITDFDNSAPSPEIGHEMKQHMNGRARGMLRNGLYFDCNFEGGRMHGDGEIKWDDGQTYRGQFHYNWMQGQGVFTYPEGATYTGDIYKGLRHGKGTFVDLCGASYVGEWRQGKKHGMGIQEFNGEGTAIYTGEWVADERHGEGEMTFPSGSVYMGQWSHSERHGQGQMDWTAKRERYVGSWRHGKQQGDGEHTWLQESPPPIQEPKPPEDASPVESRVTTRATNRPGDPKARRTKTASKKKDEEPGRGPDGKVNNRYSGQWDEGRRHGFGTFYYADGTSYEGQWVNNQKIGEGIFREASGSEYPSSWEGDRMRDPESGELLQHVTQLTRPDQHAEDATGGETGSSPFDLGFVMKELKGANQTSRELNEEPEATTLKKVQDLMFRVRADLGDIFRFYCALGVTRPEESYMLSNHQFCQFCKDCDIPSKFFPLAMIDQVYCEAAALAKSNELTLLMFMTVIMKMANLRYPEQPNLFARISSLVNQKILPKARASVKDEFRTVLYQPSAQSVLLKWNRKMQVVFKHYAATDLDSDAEAFLKINTMNLREYLHCLDEMSFIKQAEQLKDDLRSQAHIEARGQAAVDQEKKMKAREQALLKKQGVKKLYRPEFTLKEAFNTFNNANLESDWDQVSYYQLDTEMVLMEFLEGLSRLAWLRLCKKGEKEGTVGEELLAEYPTVLDKMLSDVSSRFPHWVKYLNLLEDNTTPRGSVSSRTHQENT